MPENKLPPYSVMVADLKLVLELADQAGKIAMSYFKQNPESWEKGNTGSPVSEADMAVDKFLFENLTRARPDYGWLSEETEDNSARLEKDFAFVVDPIDGTRAYLKGLDVWCVSIAVVYKNISIVGVLDCPALGEVFEATLSGGARKNGAKVTVNDGQTAKLRLSAPKLMQEKLSKECLERFSVVGHVPSLAYRLAMIADGQIDASLIKENAHDWDIAAASLIMEEAGGCLHTLKGEVPAYNEKTTTHGVLVAGSSSITQGLLSEIQRLHL